MSSDNRSSPVRSAVIIPEAQPPKEKKKEYDSYTPADFANLPADWDCYRPSYSRHSQRTRSRSLNDQRSSGHSHRRHNYRSRSPLRIRSRSCHRNHRNDRRSSGHPRRPRHSSRSRYPRRDDPRTSSPPQRPSPSRTLGEEPATQSPEPQKISFKMPTKKSKEQKPGLASNFFESKPTDPT